MVKKRVNICTVLLPIASRYTPDPPFRIFAVEVFPMFLFEPDELLVGYSGPLGVDHTLKSCAECSQVAFRVLYVKSERTQREVPLCGGHFNDACARYPQVRCSVGLRVAT